jgi:hypothetical protein
LQADIAVQADGVPSDFPASPLPATILAETQASLFMK